MRRIKVLLCIIIATLITGAVFAATSGEIEELNSKGKAASESKKLEEALSYFTQSLEIARRLKDKPATAEVLHYIGLVHVYLDQYDKSLPFYQESLTLYEELKNRQGVAANLHMLGVACSEIGQYEKARDFYERALEIRRKLGDPNQLISNLINLGGVYRFLRKNEKALFCLEEALTESRKMNSDERLVPVLYNIGGVYVSMGQHRKGLGYFEEALKLGEKLHKAGFPGYDGFIAKCFAEIGTIYSLLGQPRTALGYAEKALTIRKEIGLELEVAANLSMIGAIYHSLGQFDQSLPYHEQALFIRKKYNIPPDIVESLNNIGAIYFDLTHYDRALTYFEEAQTINRDLNLEQRLGLSATYMGNVFYVTGRFDKALASYENALRIRRKLDIPHEIASSLHDIAGVYGSQGQYERSLHYYNEALKARRALNLPQEINRTLGEIVGVYLLQRKYKEAEQIAVGSLQELYDNTEIRFKGNAPLVEVYLATGRYDQALSLLREMAPDWNNPDSYRIQFHSQRGLALKGKRRFKEASKELLLAISLSEEIRNKVRGKTGFFETSFAGGHLRAYRAIVDCLAERAIAGETAPAEFAAYGDSIASAAFYFAEATKARVLLEAMSSSGHGYQKTELPGDIKLRERELLGRSASIEARWSEAFKKGEAAFNVVTKDKVTLKKEFTAFLKELRNKHPKYAYLAYPDPIPLEKLPLGRNEVLLQYAVNEDSSYVFKVVNGKQKVIKIPLGKDQIEELVREFTRTLQTPASDALSVVGPGKHLYNILMAKAVQDVPADTKIIIVPDGILGLLPFEALVMKAGKDLHDTFFAGDRWKTSYSQSATVLALIRNYARPKPRRTLFAMGDPIFDRNDPRYVAYQKGEAPATARINDSKFSLSMRGIRIEDPIFFKPLPETRKEVLKIAEIFNVAPRPPDVLLDVHASETEMKKAVFGEYGYVHFATHGYLSSSLQGVKEPILVLSQVENKGGDDGLITMSEVLDMNLNAELVTLSSCVSGVGKVVEGEGISNFARAFQHAGARSVVVSLWEVSSSETADYMVLFYQLLRDGKDKTTALASARNATRNIHAHPFYWAPFVIYGDKL